MASISPFHCDLVESLDDVGISNQKGFSILVSEYKAATSPTVAHYHHHAGLGLGEKGLRAEVLIGASSRWWNLDWLLSFRWALTARRQQQQD